VNRHRTRRRPGRALVAALVLVTSAGLVAAGAYARTAERVPEGVFVAGLDVGGLSEAEARAALETHSQRLLSRRIRLAGGSTTGRALGGVPRIDEALDDAGTDGIVGRVAAKLGLRDHRSIALAFDFDVRRFDGIAAQVERPARNAKLVVEGDVVRIEPARAGRVLERRALARALAYLPPRVRAPLANRPAEVSTAELRRLAIREQIASFTTAYPAGEPRVTNIQRAAALLDGTIVPAGGTFSMNEALGERTEARGFVAAPTIFDGRLVDSVGGGISQVATTLYNAAFFAGLDLVAHTPHSFYIDRYPMGREATISWGGPELIFRNDWHAAVLMKVAASDTAITVTFYSSLLDRRVETATSEPFDYTQPTVREVTNAALPPATRTTVQEAGAPGFTVEYTRKVWRGAELVRDERFTTRYLAKDGIVEVGPDRLSGE
jgi:vancomycin resistance protein YoaR